MRTARTAVVTTAALVFTTMLTVEPASATPGELDTSFGTGGSTVAFKFTTASAVAVQRDGKIVVAGQYQDDVDNDPAFYVGRFQSDGQPDTAFGDGGMVITDFGASDWASGVVVQKNGRIVAAGITQGSGGSAVALARYTTSGDLDGSFGGDGKVVTDVTPDGLDYATGVATTPAGRLVVSGIAGQNAAPDFDGDMLAVRYLASGRRDRSFGRVGIARVDIAGRNDYANDVAVTPKGRVVLAGQTEVEGSDPGGIFTRAVVVALKRDGTRDRRVRQARRQQARLRRRPRDHLPDRTAGRRPVAARRSRGAHRNAGAPRGAPAPQRPRRQGDSRATAWRHRPCPTTSRPAPTWQQSPAARRWSWSRRPKAWSWCA